MIDEEALKAAVARGLERYYAFMCMEDVVRQAVLRYVETAEETKE